MRTKGLLPFFLLLATIPAHAQVLQTSKGSLEFIGLSKWTPELIYQKLGYTSLDQMHACAADLKMNLGFAEASVILYFAEGGKWYTVVTVVEPEGRDRVKRTQPFASVVLPDAWWPMIKAVASERRFENALHAYVRRNLPPPEDAEPPQPAEWWKIAESLSSDKDMERAIAALTQDRDPSDRVLGATVLANFADRDEAWHALVKGCRDTEDTVMGASYMVLGGFSLSSTRKVDWSPAVEDLRHILNGTSLFSLNHVIRALLATQVSPALAKDLIGNGGGQMLLAYLRASHEPERKLALDLLRQLSGKDLGEDPTSWEQWMRSLK